MPELPTLLSTQVRNMLSLFEQQREGRHLPVLIARQYIDGTEIEFSNMLVEDSNNEQVRSVIRARVVIVLADIVCLGCTFHRAALLRRLAVPYSLVAPERAHGRVEKGLHVGRDQLVFDVDVME